jgi:hypothetical protein
VSTLWTQELRSAQIRSGYLACVCATGERSGGEWSAKTVRGEAHPRLLVIEPHSRWAVEEWWAERVQRSVAHVEPLARIQQVHPVKGHWSIGGHQAHADEGRDHTGVGGGFQKCEKAACVIAIRMREKDPPDGRRVDDGTQRGHEVAVRQAQAGVDDDGFARVKDERVDRKESDPWDLKVVVEHRDVLVDSIRVHCFSCCIGAVQSLSRRVTSQNGTGVVSRPSPGARPETIQQKSSASSSIAS